METLVMHPTNKEQLAALKAIAKALKIPFEKKEEQEQYDPAFVKMVKDAEKSIADGNFKTYDTSKSLEENMALWENTK